jgi:hypothetical protein
MLHRFSLRRRKNKNKENPPPRSKVWLTCCRDVVPPILLTKILFTILVKVPVSEVSNQKFNKPNLLILLTSGTCTYCTTCNPGSTAVYSYCAVALSIIDWKINTIHDSQYLGKQRINFHVEIFIYVFILFYRFINTSVDTKVDFCNSRN